MHLNARDTLTTLREHLDLLRYMALSCTTVSDRQEWQPQTKPWPVMNTAIDKGFIKASNPERNIQKNNFTNDSISHSSSTSNST